jgi:hypothetical protein
VLLFASSPVLFLPTPSIRQFPHSANRTPASADFLSSFCAACRGVSPAEFAAQTTERAVAAKKAYEEEGRKAKIPQERELKSGGVNGSTVRWNFPFALLPPTARSLGSK